MTHCTNGGEIWHAGMGVRGPKNKKNPIFRIINTKKGNIPCAIFGKFAELIDHFTISCENLDGIA